MRIYLYSAALALSMGPGLAMAAEVSLYSECGYSGQSGTFGAGTYNLKRMERAGVPNDSVSSVKVSPGSVVILYKHDKSGGAELVLTEDEYCLTGNGMNDKTSSLKVMNRRDWERSQNNGGYDNYGNNNRNGYRNRTDKVYFSDGHFERTSGDRWTQYNRSGYGGDTFTELARNGSQIFLHDPRRKELVVIDTRDQVVKAGPYGEMPRVRYRLTDDRGRSYNGGGGYSDRRDDVQAWTPDTSAMSAQNVRAADVSAVLVQENSKNVRYWIAKPDKWSSRWRVVTVNGADITECRESERKFGSVVLSCDDTGEPLVIDVTMSRVYQGEDFGRQTVGRVVKSYKYR